MTHEEMIAVIQAHVHKKPIESCSKSSSDGIWYLEKHPRFNFGITDYRLAEPRWRDAIIDDLHKCPLKCRVRKGDAYDWVESELIGLSFRGQAWWQTSDCFWHTQCQVLEDE